MHNIIADNLRKKDIFMDFFLKTTADILMVNILHHKGSYSSLWLDPNYIGWSVQDMWHYNET